MEGMKGLWAAGFLLLAGCQREGVSVYKVEKETEANGSPPGPLSVNERGSQAGRLKWTAPKGWKELAGSGMRVASFSVPGKAEMSVVTLPGDAGGELANVNRWRNQIGLPPLDQKALDAAAKRRK